MNPLYQMNQNNPIAMISEIKNNPMQFLSKRGVNIPMGMNNSDEIISHLMSTGRVSQDAYNKAAHMAQMLMR